MAGWVAGAGAMAGDGEAAARSCGVHGGARQEREGRRLLEAALGGGVGTVGGVSGAGSSDRA